MFNSIVCNWNMFFLAGFIYENHISLFAVRSGCKPVNPRPGTKLTPSG
jgi:hypothetical protein